MDNRLIHMLRSARQAGKILRRYFGETLETSLKTSITDIKNRMKKTKSRFTICT